MLFWTRSCSSIETSPLFIADQGVGKCEKLQILVRFHEDRTHADLPSPAHELTHPLIEPRSYLLTPIGRQY